MRLKRKIVKLAVCLTGLVAVGGLLLVAAMWAPLYIGSSEDVDVPLSKPQAVSARQQAEYRVPSGTTVLAEITAADRRIIGGAEFFSGRFPLTPYQMLMRCDGESLGVQESVGYRERLQLQSAGSGGHHACGSRVPMGVPLKGKSVTVDVIDTQFVDPRWGVLIVSVGGKHAGR